MKISHMTYAIMIYYISLIFGAISFPFISGSALRIVSLIIVLFWLEQRFRVAPTRFDFLFLVYVGAMSVSILYSISLGDTLQRIATNLLFWLLLLATNSVPFSDYEIEAIKQSLVWSSRVTAVVLLVAGTTGEDRLLLSSSIIAEDPNYLNGYFVFGLIAAIQMLLNGDSSKRRKIIALVEILLYTYCSLATGSRGGMFSIVAATVVYILFCKETKGFAQFFKKVLIVLVALVAFSVVLTLIPQSVANRFTINAIAESNGTHRFEYWRQLFQIFRDTNVFRKLFGFGAGTIREVFSYHGYASHVAHNIFVEHLLEGGIVLEIVYLVMLVYLLKITWERNDYFSFSVIIGMVVLALSTSLYAFKPFWAIMMFVNLRRETEELSLSGVNDSGAYE